jgi:hypothetical protein
MCSWAQASVDAALPMTATVFPPTNMAAGLAENFDSGSTSKNKAKGLECIW